MRRYNNLLLKIATLSNIESADKNARRGKHNIGIIKHDEHKDLDNLRLLDSFNNLTYKTSKYNVFTIYEPKERLIYRLPYYPDRIAQWAIMNVLEPIWTNIFISHTYSCIRGRGIHKLVEDLKRELQNDSTGTKYCLKLDIRKFYPSINHDVLKSIIRKKIKDKKLLTILDEIIDSTDGVPIGNYLSQFFANLYLAYFDHWLLEEVKVKHYFRYADDIVILSDNKDFLRKVLILIKLYLSKVLLLQVKDNYQIFEVDVRGIDFVGYVFRHSHILIRKSIKKNIRRKIYNLKSMSSYRGWLKYCNSKHFLDTIEQYSKIHISNWKGCQITISKILNKNIRIIEIVNYKTYFKIHYLYKGNSCFSISTNNTLYKKLKHLKLPVNIKL